MGGLSKCMYSCVRSAGAVHSSRSIKDLRQRCLDMILDSIPVRLALPAGKSSPVVRDDQKESLKSRWEEGLHQIFRIENSK